MPVLHEVANTGPLIVRPPPVLGTEGERPHTEVTQRPAPEAAVQVRLSSAGREALARSEVAPRILDRVAEALDLEAEALDAAGREEHLESIAIPPDAPMEDTVKPILNGILGYVYAAFRLERPNEVQSFVERAVQGVERGMHDAMDLLRAFHSREAALEEESTLALESVRAGLDRFEERMQSLPAFPDDEAGAPPSGVTSSTG